MNPIGIDIIEIERFQSMHMEYGETHLEQIFTQAEWEYCHTKKYPLQSLAARFAAKEACLKLFPRETALHPIPFSDIEVAIDNYGAPYLCAGISLQGLMNKYQMKKIHVSLSHTESYACAIVMAE